jgi:hypothetical protein
MQVVFSVDPLRGYMIRPTVFCSASAVELRVQLWSVNRRTAEAEESPSLRSVTRKRLMKTLQRNSHFGDVTE